MTKTESVLGGGRKFWVANSDALTHLKAMPDECVDCVVTSPPYYGLRDYGTGTWEGGDVACGHQAPPLGGGPKKSTLSTGWGDYLHATHIVQYKGVCRKCGAVRVDKQIGSEATPEAYIAGLVSVFAEVRRVLKPKGTCFVNLGDSYSVGSGGDIKAKDLIGVPWMFAFALRAAGWYLRQEITWHKPNPTPESVRDRCVRATESIFLFAKSPRYFWNHEANQEPALGRTMFASAGRYGDHHGKLDGRVYDVRTSRNVWSLSPVGIKWKGTTKHFAAFPEELPLRCLRIGCPGLGYRCDCDTLIKTGTGSRGTDDSLKVGRGGLSRERTEGSGTSPVTVHQQRQEAKQLRKSKHRKEIEVMCGEAFAHYIRTDGAGARPIPPLVRSRLLSLGWLTPVSTSCECPPPGTPVVYDPFCGSGQTGRAAVSLGLSFLGTELNPEYARLSRERIEAAVRKRGFGFYA